MSFHILLFWYSRVGWAYTVPLLKAAQGLHMSKSGPDKKRLLIVNVEPKNYGVGKNSGQTSETVFVKPSL